MYEIVTHVSRFGKARVAPTLSSGASDGLA
jgi:hypothetical protein